MFGGDQDPEIPGCRLRSSLTERRDDGFGIAADPCGDTLTQSRFIEREFLGRRAVVERLFRLRVANQQRDVRGESWPRRIPWMGRQGGRSDRWRVRRHTGLARL